VGEKRIKNHKNLKIDVDGKKILMIALAALMFLAGEAGASGIVSIYKLVQIGKR